MRSARCLKSDGSPSHKLRGRMAGVLTLLAASVGAFAVVGVGSGAASTASSRINVRGHRSAMVKAAQAAVKKFSATQPAIVEPTIGKRIPKGRTVGILTCAEPICTTATNAAATALQKLGWKERTVNWNLTPEGYVSSWTAILQSQPNAVIYVGALPSSLVKSQFAKLKSRKIPAVALAPSGLQLGGPVIAQYSGGAAVAETGALMGDIVVANSGSTAPQVGYVYDPVFASVLGNAHIAFDRKVKGDGGTVDNVQINAANVGTSVPGQIVSFLQAHRNVKYLATDNANYFDGVPQALQSAGLSGKVKLVVRAPEASDLKEIASGGLFAGVTEENASAGWRSVDALARYFVGKPVPDRNPAGSHQVITKANVGSIKVAENAPVTPGVPRVFLKAWGLTK